jgi:prepilin-type N-terminal cleavage/methylation domain-containing protein
MQRHNGFTLIELLVVITIMTTVLSLVAPLMIEQVDKTKAAAEFAEVAQYVNDSTKVAFLRGQAARFIFEGKQLTRQIGKENVVLTFDYIFFPRQIVQINANGFTSVKSIEVSMRNQLQHITLKGQP